MNLKEAKAKLERVARDEHKQYTAAFKLALLMVLDHVESLEAKRAQLKREKERVYVLELTLKNIRSDAIGQPESTYVQRVRMHVNGVLGEEMS